MKTYKKIVLLGGTGQIGKALIRFYKDKAIEINVFTRGLSRNEENVNYFSWNGESLTEYVKQFEEVDVLINLVGKNVNCRYTEENKKEIVDSRTKSVIALSEVIRKVSTPPKIWIQAASATIYRHSEDQEMTEKNGKIGEGFSVEVCKKWEATFEKEIQQFPSIRKVILRTSIVLSENEGAFPRLKTMTKFGLGGKQGNGRQMVSWIHEGDVVGIIDFIIKNDSISGTFNCTSPHPITNQLFMKQLRQSLKVAFGLPAPKTLLEIGALIIGTETELILKSRWVIPEKLIELGYQFEYPTIEKAFNNLIH